MKSDSRERAQRLITYLCALTLAVALIYSALPLTRGINRDADIGAGAPAAYTERVNEDPITRFAEERAEVRKLETLQLNAVAADELADEGVRAEARRQLVSLAARMEQEVTLEGILRLRGYKDAVVTVHADSVNVIVRAETLSQADCARILEAVMRETGITGGNVKIMTASE